MLMAFLAGVVIYLVFHVSIACSVKKKRCELEEWF